MTFAKLFLLSLLTGLLVFSWAPHARAFDEGDFSDAELEAAVKRGSIGRISPSFYWIAVEPRDSEARNQKLLDANGRVIARVSKRFLRTLKMEGTGKLRDGRVVNFKSRRRISGGKRDWRWQICGAEAPFGLGHNNVPLVPFRSVAVDPRIIPLGSRVYIPAAKGAMLPNGKTHDGIFTAVDVGAMIKRKKIDIFTSFGDQSRVFYAVGMQTGKLVEAFLLRRGSGYVPDGDLENAKNPNENGNEIPDENPNETLDENALDQEQTEQVNFE